MTPTAVTPALLHRAYLLGWSTLDIAKAFRMNRTTVTNRLKGIGVQMRPAGGPRIGRGSLCGNRAWVR